MKSLLGYYGGKAGPSGGWITAQLPPHEIYVEPFGGMCGVLMQKRPSKVEVYNDQESALYNLLTVVRDQHEALRAALMLTPYSRKEFLQCVKTVNEAGISPVEWARRAYVVLAMSRNGSLGNTSFSFGGPKFKGSVADGFVNGQERIPAVAERLRRVTLECGNWERVCTQWDSLQTLIYFDPPYTLDSRNSRGNYSQELKAGEHLAILDWCRRAESKIVLSGYRNELYRQELEVAAGWVRRDFLTVAHTSAQRDKVSRASRVESIWLSPRAAAATPSLFCKVREEVLA
ncbi:MAG: DNA adenine methylase [Janthinobacterium lividum]